MKTSISAKPLPLLPLLSGLVLVGLAFSCFADDKKTGQVAELRKARSVYSRAVEQRRPAIELKTREVQRAYVRRLEEHQVKLPRAGSLDKALAEKSIIDALQKVEAPKPLQIELFRETKYQGDSILLDVPCEIPRFGPRPDLSNDRLQSIRIPKGVRVTVATGVRLELKTETLEGDHAEIGLQGISSLKAELKTR